MTSSIALALLATLSAPQPESARVPGFLPTRNGFHFDNNRWPPAPNYTISVLGHQFRLGKASDGLCGGMVFAVQDLFRAGAPAPADTTPPDPGAPLFNYIVGSLTRCS
ncbi:MAG TPA: hypothetical protein VKT78_16835 [Fimbriimonadaceae bacterium]|nr:hypothetical protein [Fimbriimonadaceae bacterium]